jgi:uncharacterized protein
MTERLALHSLPLFPLHKVLFPGGSLQLQVFEVRYLDLMRKCQKTGAPFGVVSLLQGGEVRTRDAAQGDAFVRERFADVGTLASITALSVPQPGLMQVQCTAGERFRVQRSHQLPHGLWVADVQGVPADAVQDIPADLQPIAQALEQVLQRLQDRADTGAASSSAVSNPVSSAPEPHQLQSSAWVANRWCELLSMPSHLQQGLMQLENPLLRLELVGDFLRQGGVIA